MGEKNVFFTAIFLSFFFCSRELLHPQNASEIFVDASRALALSTAGEELSRLRRQVGAKHELIGAAPAAGTGLASQFSSNSPDLAQLFLHEVPPTAVRPSDDVRSDIGAGSNL